MYKVRKKNFLDSGFELDWFVYSDEYTELYPYASDGSNVGGTHMKTAQQIKEEKIVTNLVSEINIF